MAISRFASTTFVITGGLLIWALNFLCAYVFVAIACARGFSAAQVLGMRVVPVVIGVTTLASAAAVTALLVLLRRRLRRAKADSPDTSFVLKVAITCSVLAVIAILWTGFVAALPVPRCG